MQFLCLEKSNMISMFSSTYLSWLDFKMPPSYFVNVYNWADSVKIHHFH